MHLHNHTLTHAPPFSNPFLLSYWWAAMDSPCVQCHVIVKDRMAPDYGRVNLRDSIPVQGFLPPLLPPSLPSSPSLPYSPLPHPVPVIILHFLPRLPICGIYNHFVQAFYQVSLCARSTSNKTTKKSYSFRLSMCCTEHGRVAFQIFKSSWKSRLFVLFCSSFA